MLLIDKSTEWEVKFTPPNNTLSLAIHNLPGRKFLGYGLWSVPKTDRNTATLLKLGFKSNEPVKSEPLPEEPKYPRIAVEGLKRKLMPFQELGVGYLEKVKGRGLLAFDMGLGKTITTLAWLWLHKEARPAVIVCPSSLKFNWKDEIQKTLPTAKIYVCQGKKPKLEALNFEFIIINYDILNGWLCFLSELHPGVVVADESQMCKEMNTGRTKALISLCGGVKYFIALSGTPMINKPYELFPTLHILDRLQFTKFWNFAFSFCGMKRTRYGWDYKGATNPEKLNEVLESGYMLRKTKEEVLKDLPAKFKTVLPVELRGGEYSKKEREFRDWLSNLQEKINYASMLTKIEYLKQAAMVSKMDAVFEWLDNFLESGKKIVVFGWHKECLDLLEERYGKMSVRIDGSTPTNKRGELVKKFQEDETVKMFIGNIKAAGVGLTLTAASTVAFCELGWTPGEMLQAEDRCHRISQKECVNVYYFVGRNTIEEKIMALLDGKMKLINKIIDGKEADEKSLLMKLLMDYGLKHTQEN